VPALDSRAVHEVLTRRMPKPDPLAP
jgi:hypothetical protein